VSIDWTAKRDEVHTLARAKGWYDRERSDDEARVLLLAELGEAVDAYREHGLKDWYEDGKPCGFASELADIIIRALDWAGACGEDATPTGPPCRGGLWHRLRELGRTIDRAPMAAIIFEVFHLAHHLGIMGPELEFVVHEKHEYNKTRPHRHGGKLA